jgi:hypothetical protein
MDGRQGGMSEDHLITCEECGDVARMAYTGRGDEHAAPKGWTVVNGRDICPECDAKRIPWTASVNKARWSLAHRIDVRGWPEDRLELAAMGSTPQRLGNQAAICGFRPRNGWGQFSKDPPDYKHQCARCKHLTQQRFGTR